MKIGDEGSRTSVL